MAFALINTGSPATVNAHGSFTFTSGTIDTTGGDLLVCVVVSWANTTAPTLSDSKSNFWNALTAAYTLSTLVRVRIFWANGSFGTSHSFTLTHGADFYGALSAAAFSGADASPADTVENGASSFGVTSLQPGSITPSNNDSLVVTGIGWQGTTSAMSAPSGYSLIGSNGYNPDFGNGGAYIIQSGSPSAENPTWTFSSSDAVACIGAFKASGGGGGAVVKPLPALGVGQ